MVVAVASLLALTAAIVAEGHTASSSSEQEKSASYKNMQLLAQDTLDGFGNGGEGFAMKLTESGRRILYVAHEEGPKCFSVLDVTQPSSPELLSQIEVPYENVRCNSLDLSGDTLAGSDCQDDEAEIRMPTSERFLAVLSNLKKEKADLFDLAPKVSTWYIFNS